jgi:hypothetical protein
MAGPVATVLIPEPLSDHDRVALRRMIDAVSEHDLDKPPALEAFWACDTRLIAGGYSGEGRPFAIETGLQPEWEPGQLAAVSGAFGFTPRDELVVIAFCNGREDHRILGELCVWLAERFGGVICFGGALWPDVPPEARIDILDADWRQLEPCFRRMVTGLSGKVVGLRYEPQPDREWIVHVGDAGFLRAWLEHPRYCMVK